MAVELDVLAPWRESRAALLALFNAASALKGDSPASADPGSPFQQARALIQRIFDQLTVIDLLALKSIDEEIARSGLIETIGDAATEARREAERIERATATIGKISSVLDDVTGVIGQVLRLPFL